MYMKYVYNRLLSVSLAVSLSVSLVFNLTFLVCEVTCVSDSCVSDIKSGCTVPISVKLLRMEENRHKVHIYFYFAPKIYQF